MDRFWIRVYFVVVLGLVAPVERACNRLGIWLEDGPLAGVDAPLMDAVMGLRQWLADGIRGELSAEGRAELIRRIVVRFARSGAGHG